MFRLNRLSIANHYLYSFFTNAPKKLMTHQFNLRLVHTTSASFNQSHERRRTREELIAKNAKIKQAKLVPLKRAMSVRELAEAMDKPVKHIYECLDQLNYGPTQNRRDSFIIANFDILVKIIKLSGLRYTTSTQQDTDFEKLEADVAKSDETRSSRARANPRDLVRRHPVVTIMGHVDHGKTTLLDSLRGTNVVASEFGGITQHIGAFNCMLTSNEDKLPRSITFLDTPGHAAFSEMRSRGAKLTDIVVLVIAAEDGVMAQTIESIEHAKATKCPIIVAINKIDKVSVAQIESVKRELLKYELICEEMGGNVQMVPISALKKTNLERLKEEIWTLAEVMELKGDPKGLVEGRIYIYIQRCYCHTISLEFT
jgi:translation initiation factor IF-2